MLKLVINGYFGRMGQTVANIAKEDEEIKLIAGIDKIAKEDEDVKVLTNIKELEEKPDVIIDFSVPEATFKILEYARENSIPVVIATTGFSKEEEKEIQEISKEIPIFRAPNMSVNINLMCKIVAEVAQKLIGADIEIIETHHNRKIDSPSGTALMLADSINKALENNLVYEFNRNNKKQKRQKNEIGFSSIRGGNIVGEHTVQFLGNNETFEVKHISYSSTVYAEGAIKGAKFLINRPNGFYDMNDII